METDKHYLRVGSFVLIMLVAIVGFSIWLVGAYDNSKYTLYRIHFAESVSGLTAGGPVKFRGLQVGTVQTIAIDREDSRQIMVDIRILRTTPVTVDTMANLKLQGITGAIFIELIGGNPQSALLTDVDKNYPPEIKAQVSTLAQIMDILPVILQKVSHIAEQVDRVFNDQNISSLNMMVSQWQKISRDVGNLTHSLKDDPSKIIIPRKEKGIPAP